MLMLMRVCGCAGATVVAKGPEPAIDPLLGAQRLQKVSTIKTTCIGGKRLINHTVSILVSFRYIIVCYRNSRRLVLQHYTAVRDGVSTASVLAHAAHTQSASLWRPQSARL